MAKARLAANRSGARIRKTSSTGSRKSSRRKKSKFELSEWLKKVPFTYLVILLLGIFFFPHGLEFIRGKSSEPNIDEAYAKPRLASFKHASTLSAEEVDELRHAYIDAYSSIARKEMKAYGIPASITLAQGLLESVAGTSRLATETNNHFGIKCFSKSCRKGHCINFGDDHHKDFFRNFEHAKESFRAHSEFLSGGRRYKSLFTLSKRDFRAWAIGLSKAGYATDPTYAEKLIHLIERYDLHSYDR